MRVVQCYGLTPEVQEALDFHFELFYSQRQYFGGQFVRNGIEVGSGMQGAQVEYPEYDRYEEGRAWQPTTCGLRASSEDVARPSDFVAVVNLTNPDVDPDSLNDAAPYGDGDFIPDVEPCDLCKEAAPESWHFLDYALTREEVASQKRRASVKRPAGSFCKLVCNSQIEACPKPLEGGQLGGQQPLRGRAGEAVRPEGNRRVNGGAAAPAG